MGWQPYRDKASILTLCGQQELKELIGHRRGIEGHSKIVAVGVVWGGVAWTSSFRK